MKKQDLAKAKLPDSPGVYFFRDYAENILYIGKATSLRDRVASYFAKDLQTTRGGKIVNMVIVADHVTYEVTGSVMEALLLENYLIKKHQPIFNTKEKDNKSYSCIVITKEDFPRVLIMRVRDYEKRIASKDFKVDKVYGPFTSSAAIRDVMKIIRKIFSYRDKCEVNQGKLCFNAQIGLCPGICSGLISKEEYKKTIKAIKNLFEGKGQSLKSSLLKDMNSYSKRQEFEKAMKIRNILWSLNHIRDVSLIKNEDIIEWKDKDFRIEAYDVAHISGSSRVGVMTVVEGGVKNTDEYRKFKLKENINDDYAGIYELLKRRFTHKEWRMPDLIVFDGGIGQKNVGDKVLASMNVLIPTCSVVKDNKHKPKDIISSYPQIEKYKKYIILANQEAHRFAISYHKQKREKGFLK
ncbi:MAG: hypothetical protein QG614_28 [Patescibacteria group bacterium]|nr:hypothetical protein [Patescibacteria group bacterium]